MKVYIKYKGFCGIVERHFDSVVYARQWLRSVGKRNLIKELKRG